MFSATVARNIAGIFGNLILLFVFTSPIPSFITICKNKKVEGYKAEPYLATALNCALWVLYGLPIVHPGNIIVIPINATGVVIEFGYLAIIFYYSPTSRKVKLGLWFIGEMVFVGIVTTCTLLLFHTHEQRSTFVGILLIISSSCLIYIAPLTIMTKVIKTKSVKYMPFSLSLAYFLNGVVWVTRALIKFDMFSLIVNGLGTVPGAVQLILYAIYYKTTTKDDEDEGADNNSKVNSHSQDSQLSGNQEEA